MKTYILYDKKYDLVKIGRTSDVIRRFRTLCTPGELYPIAVFDDDYEGALHKEFKENRVDHPERTDGRTEYFKMGGKIDAFVAKALEKKGNIPYITMATLAKKISNVKDPTLLWEISVDKAFYFRVGEAVLAKEGKLGGSDGDVVIEKGWRYMTEELYIGLSAKYRVDIYGDRVEGAEAIKLGDLVAYIIINLVL